MAYTPYYYGAAPYAQPAPDQLAQLRMQQTACQPQAGQGAGGINWVQGAAGARAYMVAPGASVLLMDSETQHFYIKSADASGMPLPLRVFSYREETQPGAQKGPKDAPDARQEEYVTRREFDAQGERLDRLAAMLEGLTAAKRTEKRAGAKEGAGNAE